MKKETMFKSTITLTLVCLIAAALLGTAYTLTHDKIEEQKKLALDENLKQVHPAADNFQDKGNYFVAKQGSEIIGYAVLEETSGYGGMIKILVGIDNEGRITGIRIMEQQETPGLGANAVKEEFYSQFKDLKSYQVALRKDKGRIDAITGATITTQAIIDGVKAALEKDLR
jgi:electron transport complex protein RnfG